MAATEAALPVALPAIGLALLGALLPARALPAEVFALSSLETVRPRGSPRGTPGAELEAARGEWEAFQVVIRAPAMPLHAVQVRAAPLRGPGGAQVALAVHRVAFLDLATPSSIEGAPGPWPDPLVPARDAFVGEVRRAFPVAVAPGADAAAWIELFVPRAAPPGLYRGEVLVSEEGGRADGGSGRILGRVPVRLRVHRFSLPPSSSMPVTFGWSAAATLAGHALARPDGAGVSALVVQPLPALQGAPWPPQSTSVSGGDETAATASHAEALLRRYGVSALRHRLSLHGGTFVPPPVVGVGADGGPVLDFRAYDREVGPFLDGTADSDGPAAGARWTAVDLRVPLRFAEPERERYLRALVDHLRSRGWLDRAFYYVADEPTDADLPAVAARARVLERAAPAVPRLVTRPPAPALEGAVTLWCPTVNLLDDKDGMSQAPPRAAYQPRLARGERLWWYQACMSHGCDIVGGPYFTGWPSLAIDAPAVAHRVLEWLTFRYRVGGELYYDTVEAYADRPGADPWRDPRRHGGNGDGTLFYPGRPALIGGTTDIPIESIRLARIRDGLEDYEYLRLLAARAGRAAADRIASTVVQRTYRFDHDPRRLLAARAAIAARLDALEPRKE